MTQETNPETVGFRLAPQQAWLLAGDDRRSVVQGATALSCPVRPADLKACLEDLSARHEILRTTFPRPPGLRDRSQAIHETLAPEWRSEAVSDDPAWSDPDELARILAAEAQRGFDLERGPLLRALLIEAGDRSLLVLSAHAACADVDSLSLLLRELMERYAGQEPADEPVQYADYAEWRHSLIAGEDEAAMAGREAWRRHAEARAAARPANRLSSEVAQISVSERSARVDFTAAELSALRDAASAAGVSVPVFLEACWHALVSRVSATEDLVLAGWCDGRWQADLSDVVGPYAQPVPIGTRIQPDTSFAEVLDQVKRARAGEPSRQDFAGAEDLAGLAAEAAAGFVAIDLTLEPTVAGVVEIAAVRPAAPTGMLLAVSSRGEDVRLEIWGDPGRPGAGDPATLTGPLRALIAGATADPSRPVALLPLLRADERAVVIQASAGPAPGESATIPFHHTFERLVTQAPSATAVAAGAEELSYGELNASANRLAHWLRDAGLERGEAVGLCMRRHTGLLVSLLGVVKAGGAYLPLNYEHPPARISHQLGEAGARFIVTEAHLLESLPAFAGEVIAVDRDQERIAGCSDTDPEHLVGPEDLVYVMYTSGSTGAPKGVKVTHGNLSNYATDLAGRLTGGTPGLRFGVVSAISTDLGNTSIFPALISGGSVQLISPEAAMDNRLMTAELDGRRLDVLKVTPSHLRVLLSGEDAAAALPKRWLVVGGEALSWEVVQQIRAVGTEGGLINHYGPTETTIGSCTYEVTEARPDSATVPIGWPIAGTRAYVLDRGLAPVPAGVPGELCIAGAGVAAGYVAASPGDSQEAGPFVADPFDGGRMYRTGDRVRALPDGAIEFLGRLDDQVKIRGFRIEPAEIEAVLRGHPAVRQAAVVPEPDDRGELRLVAYIAAPTDPTVEDLQAFLAESLPDYMVPSAFATIDSMPFTPSGKIDRRALPGIAAVLTRREAEYVPPRDEIEQEIAGIWTELLGIEQVGVFDDFFALGGHSLLATQAIMRIRRLHGAIPLRALLGAPTVAALAEAVRAARGNSETR